jgi:hypothetical protein
MVKITTKEEIQDSIQVSKAKLKKTKHAKYMLIISDFQPKMFMLI